MAIETETVDTEVPFGGPRSTAGGGRANRRVEVEHITVGSHEATTQRGEGANIEDDVITVGSGRQGRQLSESARKMLANIDKHGSVADVEGETPAEVAKPAAVAATPAPAPAATPETPAKPAEAAPTPAHLEEIERYKAVNERAIKRNQELLAELEGHRKAGPKKDLTKREQLIAEAAQLYLEDSPGALRKFIAAGIDLEDPNHADVTEEMKGLYEDLTAKELGVSLDDGKAAKREMARIRKLHARDKREQAAQREAATKPAAAEDGAREVEFIGGQLSVSKADGKTFMQRYPLLSLAEHFDSTKPEALIWKHISAGIRAGELDPNLSNDALIEAAAKKIEARYQDLGEKYAKARPGTAQPTPAQPQVASNESSQSHGARTITAQDASVAPATPPAKKTEQPAAETKPRQWKNEKERRAYLARKHAGELTD